MSPKKTILRELAKAHDQGGEGPSHKRPATIAGFSDDPEKFQKAVNDLLQARLVEGKPNDEGHMTIALNAHRLSDVRRELRPVWARPGVWALLAIVAAVGASLVAI